MMGFLLVLLTPTGENSSLRQILGMWLTFVLLLLVISVPFYLLGAVSFLAELALVFIGGSFIATLFTQPKNKEIDKLSS